MSDITNKFTSQSPEGERHLCRSYPRNPSEHRPKEHARGEPVAKEQAGRPAQSRTNPSSLSAPIWFVNPFIALHTPTVRGEPILERLRRTFPVFPARLQRPVRDPIH